MAEFITKCPHCGTELQIQNKWTGIVKKGSIISGFM